MQIGETGIMPEGGISCPASKTGHHIFNINICGEYKSEII